MPFPASGMANIKKYIELELEVYCSSCAGVRKTHSNEVK